MCSSFAFSYRSCFCACKARIQKSFIACIQDFIQITCCPDICVSSLPISERICEQRCITVKQHGMSIIIIFTEYSRIRVKHTVLDRFVAIFTVVDIVACPCGVACIAARCADACCAEGGVVGGFAPIFCMSHQRRTGQRYARYCHDHCCDRRHSSFACFHCDSSFIIIHNAQKRTPRDTLIP